MNGFLSSLNFFAHHYASLRISDANSKLFFIEYLYIFYYLFLEKLKITFLRRCFHRCLQNHQSLHYHRYYFHSHCHFQTIVMMAY